MDSATQDRWATSAAVYVGCGVAAAMLTLATTASLEGADALNDDEYRAQVQLAAVWSTGVVGWVALFHWLVGIEAAARSPAGFLGLAWPILLLSVDLVMLQHQTLRGEPKHSSGGFTFEANVVTALAFSVGSLVSTTFGRELARTAGPVLSSVIFLALAFVLPNPSVQSGTATAATFRAIRKVCFTFCIGLLSTVVLINLSATLRDPASGSESSARRLRTLFDYAPPAAPTPA